VGKGTRSGFYREVLRIADVVRPRFLFLENVAAIASAGAGGQPLAVVAGDLAARGFDAVWTSLAASDVGAPHQRNRWWCLAWRADADGVRGLEPKRGEQEKRKRSEYLGWWQVVPDISRVADGIPDQLDRDKETGNGQVPLQAAAAFVFLWQMMEAVRG
ncbi:MAG: DNA cytosine methyltransferase, partial [Gammaproteobacteria bacterium]